MGEREKGEPVEPFVIIVPEGEVAGYEQAAQRVSLGFDVLAEAGESCTFNSGRPGTLREGETQVRITKTPGYLSEHAKDGLVPFWQAKREIQDGN